MRRGWYLVLPSIALLGWWLNGKFDTSVETMQQTINILPVKGVSDSPTILKHQQHKSDFSKEFKLTFELKASFDKFIFQHELLSIDKLVEAYAKFVASENYSPQSHHYAIDLFRRYVNYKASLVEVDNFEKTTSIQAIADRLEARNDLRFEYFNEQEHHYLFAKDTAFDNAALERLRIASDVSLNKTDKQRLIEQQLATLPHDQQASFAPSLAVNRLANLQQTYTNQEVRYQAVAAEFGDDVAQRLNQQEKQQRNWIVKVNAYQQWHAQLLRTSNLTADELDVQIKQKQNEMFSELEQRRLVVYLENPLLISEK